MKASLKLLLPLLLFLPARLCLAVDETAADLVARAKIKLSTVTDRLGKLPGKKDVFWEVKGIAYHDLSEVPKTDVIVGWSGYRDKGVQFRTRDDQLVEDAGAAISYFHLEKGVWKLEQTEVLPGLKYEGFEGAGLLGLGHDQLVVYTSAREDRFATVFDLGPNKKLKEITAIAGKGVGPRVVGSGERALMVDFEGALLDPPPDTQVYYGRAYKWTGKKFSPQPEPFLDCVDGLRSDLGASRNSPVPPKSDCMEQWQAAHPRDFCALVDCMELGGKRGAGEQASKYKTELSRLGTESELGGSFCDEYQTRDNRAHQKAFLDQMGSNE